jgi:glycerol-3-phosphate dehydrogenase subunit B
MILQVRLMPSENDLSCDVMVIGSGLAGMAAALFAAHHQLNVIQAGLPGELPFASGMLDVLAIHPIAERRLWHNPWEAMGQLRKDLPDHPYAKIDPGMLKSALNRFICIMDQAGLPYYSEPTANQTMITAAGTLKPTWAIPQSMHAGTLALKEQTPALIVDITGLKGFSAKQIAENLKSVWPNLKVASIAYPDSHGEIYAEALARRLEVPQSQDKLIQLLAPHLKGVTAVGMPAILGVNRTTQIMAVIEEKLNIALFEIPTLPPSVTGIRMRESLVQALNNRGLHTFNQRVKEAKQVSKGVFELVLENGTAIHAKTVILATGRFLGGGLHATRSKVIEPLFNLPVRQPQTRAEWHRKAAFALKGHPLQTAGIVTDIAMRPIDARGKPLYQNMAVAGTILAGHQWSRQKCGAGLSIGTAWVAAQTVSKASALKGNP